MIDITNLENVIRLSNTWTEVSVEIYGYKSSHCIKRLRRKAEELNYNFDHLNTITYSTIEKECPVCSEAFTTQEGSPKEKSTCSHGCSNVFFKKNWSNGSTYRAKALRSYGSLCGNCGESRLHVLQVHHKDGDRQNNEVDNLEVLCANCHLDTHYLHR
tara:strand:+ start:8026 stop:8499 length:474 start_codon:yes stop_codon:yes gene_type:complete